MSNDGIVGPLTLGALHPTRVASNRRICQFPAGTISVQPHIVAAWRAASVHHDTRPIVRDEGVARPVWQFWNGHRSSQLTAFVPLQLELQNELTLRLPFNTHLRTCKNHVQ